MHGTCKDKTFSGDAEAAAGEGGDEAADEGRWAKSLFAAVPI